MSLWLAWIFLQSWTLWWWQILLSASTLHVIILTPGVLPYMRHPCVLRWLIRYERILSPIQGSMFVWESLNACVGGIPLCSCIRTTLSIHPCVLFYTSIHSSWYSFLWNSIPLFGYCVNSMLLLVRLSEGILYIVAFHLWSYFIHSKHADENNRDILNIIELTRVYSY